MESRLFEDLNPPQKAAVCHEGGPLLVLAGAGSGKTRVITRRIAHLVADRQVAPWRILAVTFTNKAAREMRHRLSGLLGPDADALVVSTFHSAAALLLRREAERANLSPNFVIYDDADQLQLVKRVLRAEEVDPSVTPRWVLQRIDRAKNQGQLPEELGDDDGDYRERAFRKGYRGYQKLLRAADAVDFGDLLLLLVKLLQSDADVRAHYQRRFRHVLVDEFQDTNPVQHALLRLLAPPPDSDLMVVGDDDQSIYRWRGAEVAKFLSFPDEYGARVIKLEQNYRSDRTILDAANAVIDHNPSRMGKRLWSERPAGEPLELLIHRDERAEAEAIAQRITALARESDIPFSQMAVFVRANAQSRVLEEALRMARVPYQLVSGRSFYERAEVKDAAAYLRLMVNPRSDSDLLRVINTPARGIGRTTVERLSAQAAVDGTSLFEALGKGVPGVQAAARKRLAGFHTLLDDLRQAASASAAEAVDRMLESSGLLAAYEAEDTPESATRAENLRELRSAAQDFDLARAERSTPSAESLELEVPPLQAFLEQISLVADSDGEVGEGKVALMTLHAAKGLEFDAVFLTGMEEGVFPHSRALAEEMDGDATALAEERRLCYVGFTRARRRLFCSFAQSRSLFGELKFNPPSRFLGEVPRELFGVERVAPPAPRSGFQPSASRAFRGSGRRDWEDEGPRVDRSYDQSAEYMGSEDGVVGLRVHHGQFGEGRVVACDGVGPNAKLTVSFGSGVGLKRVIARFLQPA